MKSIYLEETNTFKNFEEHKLRLGGVRRSRREYPFSTLKGSGDAEKDWQR